MIIHSPTKFKGKKKWASADAKRKDAELQAEWQAFSRQEQTNHEIRQACTIQATEDLCS